MVNTSITVFYCAHCIFIFSTHFQNVRPHGPDECGAVSAVPVVVEGYGRGRKRLGEGVVRLRAAFSLIRHWL